MRIGPAKTAATPATRNSVVVVIVTSFSICGLVRLVRLGRWLEELDGIAVGIFDLDLSAGGTSLHLIAKLHTRDLQRVDLRRQIGDAKDHAIRSARLLGLAAGHRTRS